MVVMMSIDHYLVWVLPGWLWPWIGRWRGFYWGVLRSEAAQRRHIVSNEIAWCGKGLNPEELDDLIADQRPAWRRRK